MNRWYRYSTVTGRFNGQTLVGDKAFVDQNQIEGFALFQGEDIDWRRNRVDLETGELVTCQPDKPADTDDTAYTWDAVADDWIGQPTTAKLDRDARAKRSKLLAESDWVTLRASDAGQPIPQAWALYRAALRDITSQSGYPTTIDWPVAPT